MAPNTAINFVLLGLALALMDVKTAGGRRPTELLSCLSFLVSLLALAGYAYRVPEFSGIASFIPMALHTASTFVLFALGVFVARPTSGIVAVVVSPTSAGALARGLYPAMVVALLTMGWLRLEGERLGFYGTALGVVLYTMVMILVMGVLVWWSVKYLYRAETGRAAAEAGRDDALALNRLVMDNSLDVICVVDASGRFVEVSSASTGLWGYEPEELIGRAYIDLVHPDDRDKSLRVATSIMAGEPALDFDNRYVRKDGSLSHVRWSARWSEANQLMFCIARDDAPRIAADDRINLLNQTLAQSASELQQTNRELEAFTYTVSHDLRAPLRHVAGYAKMLDEDAGDRLDGELRRYLDAIGSSARHMGTLIDDLLAFSRLGRKPVDRLRVDMHELTNIALRDLGGESGASPAVRVAGKLPHLLADPVLLKQVWVNLISNALKYSSTRGAAADVEISGERDGALVRYRIRDNGVGFDMRYVDKLFGVFQRLHAQEEFEGTGVGLAIVQRIVTRHGGRIWAEGELDRGATFTFELPVAESEVLEVTA